MTRRRNTSNARSTAARYSRSYILPDGARLARPTIRELAERIGLDTRPDEQFYDLVIVGGGPAGLSAAVYAASEKIPTMGSVGRIASAVGDGAIAVHFIQRYLQER